MIVVGKLARRWRWDLGLGREVGLAFWAMTFLEAAFGSYMGIWPLWIERLGAPVAIVGLVLGASGVLRILVLLPSATLSERFGVRRLIILARIAAFVGLVGAAIATHWTQLVIMVVGSAIGELAFPLIKSHVAQHAGTNRIRAFTLVFTVGPSTALFFTPLLAGVLIELTSLRSAFILAATCTALSIAFFWQLKPGKPRVATASGAAGSYRHALEDGAVLRLLILQGTTVFALALGTSLVPTFLEDVRGLSPATIASLGALAAIGSTVFGLAVVKVGRLQRAPYFGAALAVALTAAGFTIFLTSEAIVLIGIAFVCRGGLFSAWALFNAGIAENATEMNRARSFALSEMIAGLGMALAPMVAGPLFAWNAYAPLTAALVAAICLIPVLLVIQRATRRPTESIPVPAASREPDVAAIPADAPAV